MRVVRSDPRLVGRDAEHAVVIAALEQTAGGVGQALLIEGEAGIGKTRLLEHVLQEATARGLRVVRGAAHELEQTLPFTPLVDALGADAGADDPRQAALGRMLLGEEGGGDEELLRLRVVRGFVDLVEGLAEQAPVVLALEDVHWADPSTLAVVGRLVRRLSLSQVCLLLTRRPYPEPQGLRSLLDSLEGADAPRIVLPPLGEDDVETMVRELLGADVGPGLRHQLAAAGGNPLYVRELISALDDEGAITLGPDAADAWVTEPPPSLRRTILRRLGALPKETVDALRLAAVLGANFDLNDLAVVAARPSSEVSVVLDPALRAGVISASVDRLRFRHDLIHEAVYADLPAAVRQGLHAQAARALGTAGRPALHVAPHVLRGASPGDAEAVERLRQTATAVGPSAQTLAAELLRRAVELEEPDHPGRAALEVELARALIGARQPVEAEALARRLLAEGPAGSLKHQARVVLADALAARHRVGDAAEHLEEAFRERELGVGERALLAARIAVLWDFRADLDRSETWASEAIRLGEAASSTAAQCGGLVVLAIKRHSQGFAREAEQLARRAAQLRAAPPVWIMDPRAFLAFLVTAADHPEQGIPMFREEIRRHERLGSPVALYHDCVARAHFCTGQWDDAATEWEVALRLGEETASGAIWMSCVGLSWVALGRDHLAEAAEWLSRAERAVADDDTRRTALVYVRYMQGLLAEASGRPERALRLLEEAARRCRDMDVCFGPLSVDLARLAAEQAAVGVAEAAAGDAEIFAERSNLVWAQAAALQCRGLAQGDRDLLRQAVATWQQTSWIPATAAASVDAARVMDGSARSSEAVAFAEEGLGIWQKVGAAREIARAEGLLRHLGVRRGRRGPRRRPRSGWGSVTGSEHKVVELVAQGLTYQEVADRLFVSRRTVESHVSHLFAKLGVSSRRELVRAWGSRSSPS